MLSLIYESTSFPTDPMSPYNSVPAHQQRNASSRSSGCGQRRQIYRALTNCALNYKAIKRCKIVSGVFASHFLSYPVAY